MSLVQRKNFEKSHFKCDCLHIAKFLFACGLLIYVSMLCRHFIPLPFNYQLDNQEIKSGELHFPVVQPVPTSPADRPAGKHGGRAVALGNLFLLEFWMK